MVLLAWFRCSIRRKVVSQKSDLEMVHAITEQVSATLQNAQGLEQQALAREKEKLFIDLVSDVTAEIELGSLLQRVMVEATKMLNAGSGLLFSFMILKPKFELLG